METFFSVELLIIEYLPLWLTICLISADSFQTDRQTDRQTDKQMDRQRLGLSKLYI